MKRFFLLAISIFMITATVPTSGSFAQASESKVQQEVMQASVSSKKQRVLITYAPKLPQTASVSSQKRAVKYVTKRDLLTLSNQKDILYIEQDVPVKMVVRASQTQTSTWGVKRLQPENKWTKGITGKGVKVAVIDTGIAKHEDLVISGGVSFVPYTSSYNDDHGHGTHVAGIIGAKNNKTGIVGIAPDALLYGVKVLDQSGDGYLSDVISGIEWSIENEMDVINLSLSADSSSYALEQVVKKATDAGIVIVAAAGNKGARTADTMGYPAKLEQVISVGATTEQDKVASFSSVGQSLKLTAPGENIYSTYKGNTYKSLDGTSMATPFVAGAVALLIQENDKLSVKEIQSVLYEEAADIGKEGRDSQSGYGLVQLPVFKELTLTTIYPKVMRENQRHIIRVKVGNQAQESVSGAEVTWTLVSPAGEGMTLKRKTGRTGIATFVFVPRGTGVYLFEVSAIGKGFVGDQREVSVEVRRGR